MIKLHRAPKFRLTPRVVADYTTFYSRHTKVKQYYASANWLGVLAVVKLKRETLAL